VFSIARGEVAPTVGPEKPLGVDVPDRLGEVDGLEGRMEENPCGKAEVRREKVVRPVESDRWSSWRPIV